MKQKLKLTNILKYAIMLICIIAFLAILEDVYSKEQIKIDNIIYEFIILNIRQEPLTLIMKIITTLGSAYCIIAITAAIIIFEKDNKTKIVVLINLIVITLMNQLLKNIVQRPRPVQYMIIKQNGYSFPSGHSMISVAFYGLIIYLLWKNMKNKKYKYITCTILTIITILIGFSRIYLGVHYTSDVLAGGLLSIAYLILYTSIIKTQFNNNQKKIVEK